MFRLILFMETFLPQRTPKLPKSFTQWSKWSYVNEMSFNSYVGYFFVSVSYSFVFSSLRLYWPKSRCFDYLYQDAEMLLRNYPVQATICPYEDSSSDEDSDDEEEEMEKELNWTRLSEAFENELSLNIFLLTYSCKYM